jgi:hypothetical protein
MNVRYTIQIDTEGAAFEDQPGCEIARILRELANTVEGFAFDRQNRRVKFPVRDINGNRCGTHGYK